MKGKQAFTPKNIGERSISTRIVDIIVKIGAFFIILEPIWMLLPFAGFLYGSVLPIEFLSRNPYTSWLVHFVFKTHTLFPLGLILIFIGFSIFLVCAFQIYSAKLLKKGLIKAGIYRKFRHPQYVSLTLFGIGILLTWGRFITFIAFFIMLWLYYFLSKTEERKCLQLFGEDYEDYRNKTYFIFPGEQVVFAITRKILSFNLPKWTTLTLSFLLVVCTSISSGFLIQGIRSELRSTIPFIEDSLALYSDSTKTIKLLMVKGPVLQASPSEEMRGHFMEKFFEMLTSSQKIRQALSQFDLGEEHTLLIFLTPGSNWHSGLHGDFRVAKVNAFIVIIQTPVPFTGNNFMEFRKSWQILKLIRAQEICYARMEAGQDPTEGKVIVTGPPLGIAVGSFQDRMEERINFFLSGL